MVDSLRKTTNSPGRRSPSLQGQVYLEAALVLPILLFVLMGVIQALYLAYVGLRVEAAAHAAARSAIALGDQDPQALLRIKTAAALVLVPVSPSMSGTLRTASGPVKEVGDALSQILGTFSNIPGIGTLVLGLDRFFYAYRYTRVCREQVQVRTNDPAAPVLLGLRVEFLAPLLIPVVNHVLGTTDHDLSGSEIVSWRSEWSQRGNALKSPLFQNLFSQLSSSLSGIESLLTSFFASFPKLSMRASYPVFLYNHPQGGSNLLTQLGVCL